VFFALWHQIPAIEAGKHLLLAEGARLGQLLAESPKESVVRSAVRRLEKRAVPLIYPRLPE
jgi:hypothetical protein